MNNAHKRAAFDAIADAIRQIKDVTRTLIVHPDIEQMARDAVEIHGDGPWRIVTNDSMDPGKVFVMASPAEVRARVEHFAIGGDHA